MPKEVKTVKEFLEKARRKDAQGVQVINNGPIQKWKCRCSRYLYTVVITDPEKGKKLKQSLPPGIQVKEIK